MRTTCEPAHPGVAVAAWQAVLTSGLRPIAVRRTSCTPRSATPSPPVGDGRPGRHRRGRARGGGRQRRAARAGLAAQDGPGAAVAAVGAGGGLARRVLDRGPGPAGVPPAASRQRRDRRRLLCRARRTLREDRRPLARAHDAAGRPAAPRRGHQRHLCGLQPRARGGPDAAGVRGGPAGAPRRRAARRRRARPAVGRPGGTRVGLVGVAGGRGLVWGKWWSGRVLAGHTNDPRAAAAWVPPRPTWMPWTGA